MKIGVCGTGRMGSSIAQRLMSVGHEVGVWNRNSTKTKPLIDAGAKLFASPAELIEGCEAVIDMCTVRPGTMQGAGAAVKQQDAAFVECPVAGSTGPAKEGKLLGLVGGENRDLERAMPVLQQLCRRVEHVGPLGAGATVKLAINLPLLVYWQA